MSGSAFWRNIKKLLVINPALAESMSPRDYRTPSPGSQPATHAEPVTHVSNISKNYYYDRDARRSYPRTLVVAQEDLAKRIAAPAVAPQLEAPGTAPAVAATTLPLIEAIQQCKTPLYTEGQLPPVPGTAYRWRMATHVTPAPANTYWPVYYVR